MTETRREGKEEEERKERKRNWEGETGYGVKDKKIEGKKR